MADLQLRYDAALPYQLDAIAAVVDLFDGQPLATSSLTTNMSGAGTLLSEYGQGNALALDDVQLLTNLRAVQARNQVEQSRVLGGRDYTIEMETGTGKTYVYLRTAFELSRTYGFRKFIIVVPSVAIREGVLHSIASMREHFRSLYTVPFDASVYDSKQLGRLRSFATANTLQFLIINIQAFQRDVREGDGGGGANVIYRENDRLSGHKPIDFLQASNPIVIMDEPQKLTGQASVQGIERLHPLCTLRYSATYDDANKIYRLGPIEAFDQQLVKRIEVASVREESNANNAYIRLLKLDAKKQTAQIEINVGSGAEVKPQKVTVRKGDDLVVKSQPVSRRGSAGSGLGRQEYRGYRIDEIDFDLDEGFIAFANGVEVPINQARGGLDDEVMRAQVRETVREHLDKERKLRPLDIKVLSLFFIDRVANYRQYADDGSPVLGKIGQWFEQAYTELSSEPRFRDVTTDSVASVHNGYFATDRKGTYRDSTEGRGNKDDEGAYELIMRDKERLLSLDVPLRFIFSHSALREGWDNPNVFQICTLNETRSVNRKRQEIGRGLRLPVNQHGERIHDEFINRLTVIANESYRDFAAQLQTEYESETGIRFGVVSPIAFAQIQRQHGDHLAPIGQEESRRIHRALTDGGYLDRDSKVTEQYEPNSLFFHLQLPEQFAGLENPVMDVVNRSIFTNRVVNARRRQAVKVNKQVVTDPRFMALWNHINQRTRYRVSLDTDALVANAIAAMCQAAPIRAVQISTETRSVTVSGAGVGVGEARRVTYDEIAQPTQIPDVLAYLQNETDLTRDTLVKILLGSGRLKDLLVNPQAFITMATTCIKRELHRHMLGGIIYDVIPEDRGKAVAFESNDQRDLERYLDTLYRIQNTEKSPFNYVAFDSKVEEQFAKDLDANQSVRYFVKLPKAFLVDTPVGPYNPDWAIMLTDRPELYLVRETKSTLMDDERRQAENDKIACARKHYQAIDTDYDVTTSVTDMLRRLPDPLVRQAE